MSHYVVYRSGEKNDPEDGEVVDTVKAGSDEVYTACFKDHSEAVSFSQRVNGTVYNTPEAAKRMANQRVEGQ